MGISYDAAVHAVEIAAISLTVFNGVAAGLVILLSLVDNYRHTRSWSRISIERRAPLYLAVCILVSHVVFAVREFLELGSGIPVSGEAGTSSQLCTATSESSWWCTAFCLKANSSDMVSNSGPNTACFLNGGCHSVQSSV
jgi:hypothetical protein